MIKRQEDLIIYTENGPQKIPYYRESKTLWGALDNAEIELDFSKYIDKHRNTRIRLQKIRNFINKYIPFRSLFLRVLRVFENKYKIPSPSSEDVLKYCMKITFTKDEMSVVR